MEIVSGAGPGVGSGSATDLELLSVADVAQQAGVSEQAVRKALAEGRLAGERGEGHWQVPARAASAWVERARRRKAAAQAAAARREGTGRRANGSPGDGAADLRGENAALRERLRVVTAERDALAAALEAITGSMRAAG